MQIAAFFLSAFGFLVLYGFGLNALGSWQIEPPIWTFVAFMAGLLMLLGFVVGSSISKRIPSPIAAAIMGVLSAAVMTLLILFIGQVPTSTEPAGKSFSDGLILMGKLFSPALASLSVTVAYWRLHG